MFYCPTRTLIDVCIIMMQRWPSGPGRDSWWRGRWSCRLENLQWCCLPTRPCSLHPASVGGTQHQDTFSHSHNHTCSESEGSRSKTLEDVFALTKIHRDTLTEQHLGLSSCLSPTHLLGHRFLDCLGLLLGSGRDWSLQFSLCSPLLGQELRVDVGQDSACCNGHAF